MEIGRPSGSPKSSCRIRTPALRKSAREFVHDSGDSNSLTGGSFHNSGNTNGPSGSLFLDPGGSKNGGEVDFRFAELTALPLQSVNPAKSRVGSKPILNQCLFDREPDDCVVCGP